MSFDLDAMISELVDPARSFTLTIKVTTSAGATYWLDGRQLTVVEMARIVSSVAEDLRRRA